MNSTQFRPGYEAAVAKPFTFAGTKYAKGDRFPYRDLGVIDFDLRGLWVAELIGFGDQLVAAAPAKASKPAQQNTAPARR